MDSSNGFFNGFYKFGDTVMLLFYVNFLWFCFTLMGLVIFGIGPSTVAMFSVFREWSMGKTDVQVFKTFWNTYKKEFFKGNGIAWIIITLGYILYVNLNYLEIDNEWLHVISRLALYTVAVIYGIMSIYIIPIYVHYDNKFFNHIRNAILIAVFQPIRTIYIIAACLTLYYLFFTLPVFIFLLGPSLSSMVIMWISYRTFIRIEIQQEVLQERAQEKAEEQIS